MANWFQRHGARRQVADAQPFVDEPVLAAGALTWIGNTHDHRYLGWQEGAGGFPQWVVVAVGENGVHFLGTHKIRSAKPNEPIGSWSRSQVGVRRDDRERALGPLPLGSYRCLRFEFPDRDAASLQLWGYTEPMEELLLAGGGGERKPGGPPPIEITGEFVGRTLPDGTREEVRWDELEEVSIVTTAEGPFEEDVFYLLIGPEGRGCAVPHGQSDGLIERLQGLPGFDSEELIRAMARIDEGISTLWRR
jgi:hypothetical protein